MIFTRTVKFLGRSIIVKYTFHALVWISPLDRAPGHFGQRIIVIKLILVDFDGHNANITLKIYMFMLCKNFTCTGRDGISIQFASRDFRPCWIYLWGVCADNVF